MKKFFKFPLLVAAAAVVAIGVSSCSNDDTDAELSEKDVVLQKANIQFVNGTVVPTYKALANNAILLQKAVEALTQPAGLTNANIVKAGEVWKSSRQYWEWSEAFLFGAASKYYIDPHIDTWPLDKVALENLLNNEGMMNDIENTITNLNNGLVGFHGLEYILFRQGAPRSADAISVKELKYAVAVAKDLTLSCIRLEAAWAGIDTITKDKLDILKDAEMEPEDNFGEQMVLCGYPGSTWKSVTAGSEEIIEGCKTIVDEVGASKIGKPYTGEDVEYIESPHAYNSIRDFEDNIVSVRNAYFGALGATTAQTASVSAYIRSVDPVKDQAVIDAIENCISKIREMPKPFVENYKDPKVKVAIDACDALNTALIEAQVVLRQQ